MSIKRDFIIENETVTINFNNINESKLFGKWVQVSGNSDVETFRENFKGVYDDTREFAENYTMNECEDLDTTPDYIVNIIDWDIVWNTHLTNKFMTISVYNDLGTPKSVAIFSI